VRNRDLRPAAKANPTIQQAFERFQKYNRLKNLSQGSLDFYAAKGRSFFRFLGDTEQPIHTITEETVEDYIFYMKDQQLHDTTINTNLRMVRAFLYWCMEKGYLEKYPIRLVRADDPIKEPYTTDELQKLLKEPDCKTCSFAEYRNWVIVNFLLGTGCRASTLLNLQIGDLDLSAGTVFFRHMKARNQQIVPLSKALVKIMEVMLEKKETLGTLASEVTILPQLLKNVRVADKAAALNDPDVQAAGKAVDEALGNDGRLLLRQSGTEPLIRVMVEAETPEICEKYVDQVIDVLKKKGHVTES
jgi:site-specific recombinase XerD